jgi:hypothetical protein
MADEIKPKSTKSIEEPVTSSMPPAPTDRWIVQGKDGRFLESINPEAWGDRADKAALLSESQATALATQRGDAVASPAKGLAGAKHNAIAQPAAAKPHDKTQSAGLLQAFMSIGLTEYSASLLAAHAWATTEAPETTGRTEAIVWAESFKRLNPVVWGDLLNGNLNGFVAALQRSNIEGLSAPAYAELSSSIRG